jgi:hypothetical protein
LRLFALPSVTARSVAASNAIGSAIVVRVFALCTIFDVQKLFVIDALLFIKNDVYW